MMRNHAKIAPNSENSVPRLRLDEFTREVLDLSWIWFQHAKLRKLTLTPAFTRQQQLSFFEKLPHKTDYLIWAVVHRDYGPIGAAGLKNFQENFAEYWGYIGIPKLWGRGLGRQIIALVEAEAINRNFVILDLWVSEDNFRARNLYENLGYRACQSKSRKGQIYMQKPLLGATRVTGGDAD